MPRGRRRSPTRDCNRPPTQPRPSGSRRLCCVLGPGCPVTATTSWRGRSRRTSSAACCAWSVASTLHLISPSASRCRWSDGEPLGAADFASTLTAMREQDVPTAHLLYDVDARAVDEATLELRFPEPVAHIPYLFAQLPFFPWPRHKLEELGAEWHAEAKLVGNGPFALAEANEERVVFTRNPHWPSFTSNVAELTVYTLDPFGARDKWQAGRLDFVFFAQMDLDDFPDAAILRAPALSTEFVGFPDHAPFDDVRVRRALAHGLDRAPLTRGSGNAPAHGGFLPPAMPGHSHDLAPAYDL